MTASIDHVVVLMYENRSFDHMVGLLPPPWGDLTGAEYNLVDPASPASPKVFVDGQAPDECSLDPNHSFGEVQIQLFGGAPPAASAPMNGFVLDYIRDAGGNVQTGMEIMQCHAAGSIPALHTLAQQFCLCTNWFASVPGPTWPNRFYVHAATSAGEVANNSIVTRTIWDNLAAAGTPWHIYYGDVPQSLAILNMLAHLGHYRPLETFFSDVQHGTLPAVSFIEPRYFDFLFWKGNDEHPPHLVSVGDALLAEVYDTLRNSALWANTLLVVLYDEHGGFYDKVAPPTDVPNPDGKSSTDPPFDFTALGVRTPAVLVSPLIPAGIVDPTVYEHSSFPATIKKLFGLPSFLTRRDAAANTFDGNLTLATARGDAPTALPTAGDPGVIAEARRLIRTGITEVEVATAMARGEASMRPPTDFQRSLIRLVKEVDHRPWARAMVDAHVLETEHAAAVFVQERIGSILRR